MLKTIAWVGLLVLSACFSSPNYASAAMQIPARGVLLAGPIQMPVTFWAQPYPYRYVPRQRCPLVRVETPYGWYRDRVCVGGSGPVLRRAY